MVGVAGRSKGCSTCRKRKKGCDLARPECGQCRKGGKVCGGYERDLTFIHHKVPLPNSQSSSEESSPGSNESWSSGSDDLSWLDEWPLFDFPDPNSSSPSTAVVQAYIQDRQVPQLLPPSLQTTALTSLHISLFNSFYLPRDTLMTNASSSIVGFSSLWTNQIPSLVNNDPSLQIAYLALTSSRIGYDSHDKQLLSTGKQLYGKALREMGRALQDPKRRHTDETLLACSTLGLYEIFEAETFAPAQQKSVVNGWLSHSAAVTRLLEIRGPEAYTEGSSHVLFLHARILTVIRAATAQRTTFLSQPEWMTVPWRNHPKSLQHQLIDIMIHVPTVLEAHNYLDKTKDLDLEQLRRGRQSLYIRCKQLSRDLDIWYAKLLVGSGEKPLWGTFKPDDPSYPFGEAYSFDDHPVGYSLMLYWTNCLIVNGILLHFRSMTNEGFVVSNLPDPNEVQLYAFNIAKSLPFFLSPEMGALGPNMILFPVGMAIAYFARPRQSFFIPDYKAMQTTGSIVDLIMDGTVPDVDNTIKTIISWFFKLFNDLSGRGMPGGAFLAGLMRAVVAGGVESMFEV